jgi:hypothetical protein
MLKSSKLLKIIGYLWLSIFGIFLLWRYLVVLSNTAVPFAERFLSFLNIWNVFFALILLMPGLLCLAQAKKINSVNKDTDSSENGPRASG